VNQPPYTLDDHARDMNWAEQEDDYAIDALGDRIAAVEEIIAARWPRRMLLRWRLGRSLRLLPPPGA
jgi:hypothetical protein